LLDLQRMKKEGTRRTKRTADEELGIAAKERKKGRTEKSHAKPFQCDESVEFGAHVSDW